MTSSRYAFVALIVAAILFAIPPAANSNTPNPSTVVIAGDLQTALGCTNDWDPACLKTQLLYDATDDVWQNTFTVPAGNWEYKAALNGSWTENYGANATANGANISLSLAASTPVKFYYDHKTHWITSSANSVIATVAGDFQSKLGCSGDWQPDCLRSWLEDPTGSGIYSFTATIPGGNYQAKVAINESWTENYGQGGVPNGPNIPFTVPGGQANVTFTYDPNTHILTISASASQDNNVEWDGLRHDSRDLLYRSPGGAVPAGTPVKVRFRTFHNDVTNVLMRVYDVNAAKETFVDMNLAASDVSCYQASLSNSSCDFWEATLTSSTPDNLWYRFIVSDGTSTAYYADNTSALDGGLGSPTSTLVDNSYALMFYNPQFTTPSWPRDAVIYQIFPDRFRNGRHDNDPHTGDIRYDDPVLALPWGTLPEGYCHNYAEPDSACPWRFDSNPPSWSPTREAARSRDYFGGDVKGIDQELDYLQNLGVTTLYLNPIFDSASNHGYDTQNYLQLDPYFGTQKDWDNLAKHTAQRGMRIILDGVFNHMSSDSPFFDRYHHFGTVGACESASSPYRSWFTFRPPSGTEPAVCAPSTPGGNDTFYNGWFGFDSLPVLTKTDPAVQKYFLTGSNSVTRHWLQEGASGWRLDVMGDPSFPNGYWETFRQVVKQTKPNALIVGELWQKDSTLLRFLRGDRADSTMDYRLRDAVVGFLAPQNFDAKGFPDSGRQLSPSEFTARLSSIREDYPKSVYYSLMNLLDSHDTERLLWTLTPGAEDREDKEFNSANLAEGKRRLELASLIQFSLPGAPTIYYGDEVGVTGDDDPDDRRTYPWADLGGTPDMNLFAHYQTLISLRKQNPALTDGDFRSLLADDTNQTVALGRKSNSQGAVLALNRSQQPQTLSIPVSGYFPNGLEFSALYGVNNDAGTTATVSGGVLQVTLNAESGMLLATRNGVDLKPPEPAEELQVTNEGDSQVSLAWEGDDNATYNVYQSPVSGGGYVKANTSPITGTSYTDTGLSNAVTYYFVVTAVDAAGNESAVSNEVSAMPHYVIGWSNLQWPPTLTHTISAVNRTDNVYGQVWINGVTSKPGPTPTLRAQLGFGPSGSDPATNPAWSWVDATFNKDAGNNDEFVASLLPDTVGTFDYAYRYTTTNGRDWVYADLDGSTNGYSPSQAGKLTVNASSDTTPPAAPANLRVTMSSLTSISLAWDAVTNDPTMYGYEVLRSATSGGPYTTVGTTTATTFTDTAVVANTTYYYAVRSVDQSFNRSGISNEVSATAQARKVKITFNVTVPASTDGTGFSVYIAGTLDQLDGNLPVWDPAGVKLTRIDANHWTITLSGTEGTQLQYKYALGSWNYVEKDASCGEIANRMLTLTYGTNGTQVEDDTVPNWRNVAPCGN